MYMVGSKRERLREREGDCEIQRERERETLFEKARERKETKYGELESATDTAGPHST